MKFLLIFGLLALGTHSKEVKESICQGEDCPPLYERTNNFGQSGDGYIFQVEDFESALQSADISGPQAADIENLLADNQLVSTQAERTNTQNGKRTRLRESWPQLVGKPGWLAQRTIKRQRPSLNVIIIPQGMMVTMDYRLDRVRIFVDSRGNVKSVPTIG